MRRLVIVFVLVAAGIIGWLYWTQSRPERFIVSGLVEADQIRVGSRVGGRVAEVFVAEGQSVKAGKPLLKIDPFDLRERLAEATAALAAAQAELTRLKGGFRAEEVAQARAERDQVKATLAKLVAGPRPAEIEIAREQLNAAKASLELAESEYARLNRLREAEQAAPTEFDEAVRTLKTARAEVAAAERRLALLEEGTRKEEIAEARAALARAEAALKLLEDGYRAEDIAKAAAEVAAGQARVEAIGVQIGELTVAAPCDCVVEAIDLQPGDLVAANAPAISLLDPSKLWVRAYVPEARLGQVALGQRTPVMVDSFPDRKFAARVSFISREAEFTPRNIQTPEERSKQVFRIKVTLEEGLDMLRVGMAADVLLDEVPGG
jgi:multidrug resistance efflux pump